MPKKPKPKKAQTLDDVKGVASDVVHFLRTDARAAVSTAPVSRTRLKQSFEWELAPRWPLLAGDDAAAALRHVSAAAGPLRAGLCIGRAAVTRALRRRELRAVVLARDAGPPLLSAHLAALAQDADAPVSLLACGSAQLGQPFGLLRASAVGLRSAHFAPEHALVVLLKRGAQQQAPDGPLPWLNKARAGIDAAAEMAMAFMGMPGESAQAATSTPAG